MGGGVLPMGVGAGKTLLAYLLPTAMGIPAGQVVVLVPGALVREYRRQLRVLREHFVIPAAPHVLSYEKVGHPTGAALLSELVPKLIVADEAHMLANKDSARVARFLRYAKEARPRFVAMSASLLRRKLADFAHLAELALGEGSPLPLAYNFVEAFDRALGASKAPAVGWEYAYFNAFATEQPPTTDYERAQGGMGGTPALERWARAALNQRLLATLGVVGTEEPSCDAPILGRYWTPPEPPQAWVEHARQLERTLRLPCGQQVESALAIYEHRRTLRMGYYARWGEVADLVDRDWLYARRGWASALASLVGMRREGLDSPALAEEAIRAMVDGDPPARKYTKGEQRALAEAAEALRVWEASQHLYHGDREWVRLPGAEEYWAEMAEALHAFAHSHGPTLVWAKDRELAALLAAAAPLHVCAPGQHPGEPGQLAAPWRLVSIASHGTGLNLQPWQHNVLLHLPSDASALEQLLGRTHRPGQAHDHVGLWLLDGDSLDEQLAQAALIYEVTSQKQRLTGIRW